ncbi:MAG: type II secretion system protein, partial [Bacteroidetes bacterium]|nr:type II secretion system protein [Bacteroidota bacterium]
MNRRYRHGFTLIELLIVVAIIGILAAIAVPNFLNARVRAQISRAQSELRSIGDAYTMYFMDQNSWPPHADNDPAQHRFATTPIAYLSTSVIDVFAQSEHARKDFSFPFFQGQYHCEPSYFWYSNVWTNALRANPSYFEQTKNSAYYVMSLGPDNDFDESIASAALYDSSNGLLS